MALWIFRKVIILPTTYQTLLQDVVIPAMSIFPESMDTQEARIMLLAINGQESGLAYREQIQGPAHSMWMFEPNGIRGVLTSPATATYAKQVCDASNIDATVDAVYGRMLQDDILGCRFARLLLWTDASALPSIGAVNNAWAYYIQNWRPGRPDRNRWTACYHAAIAAISAQAYNAPMALHADVVLPVEVKSGINDFVESVIQPTVEPAAVPDLIDAVEPAEAVESVDHDVAEPVDHDVAEPVDHAIYDRDDLEQSSNLNSSSLPYKLKPKHR